MKVQQLLHGYRSGHGQISSSVRLGAQDADLITRLSDLSGSLSTGTRFASYLTFYPLPTREYYAVAKTWPDPDAPRTGCVVTHTLLVPLQTWSSFPNVNHFRNLFTNPRAMPDHDFSKPLFLLNEGHAIVPTFQPDEKASEAFVSRYFGGATRPLVWFETANAEEYVWRLVQHLWPKLRGMFSCCSYSLRQRTLEDRPFDLLFAPDSVYSRFTKLPPDHIIQPRTLKLDEPAPEAWIRYWSKAFFSASQGLPAGEDELSVWQELDTDPTAIRKLSLIQELRSRASESPTAGVGAIDVVESLARDPLSALTLKREVLQDAIAGSYASGSIEESATCLRLIDDRLRRDAFSTVAGDYLEAISDASTKLTVNAPAAVLATYGPNLGVNLSEDSSAFGSGVFRGLIRLANSAPFRLDILGSFPRLAAEIFCLAPNYAVAYYRFGGETAVRNIASWFLSNGGTEAHKRIRKNLLSEPDICQHSELLADLFAYINESEVGEILNILRDNAKGLSEASVRRSLLISDKPKVKRAIRRWAGSEGAFSFYVNELAAETFQRNVEGFTALIESRDFQPSQKARVMAAYLEMLGTSKHYWLRTKLAADNNAFQQLLEMACENQNVEWFINQIVTDLTALPVAKSPELLRVVLGFQNRAASSELLQLAIKDAFQSLFQGWTAAHISRFIQSTEVAQWIERASTYEVVALVVQSCHREPVAVSRAWRWIADAPDVFYSKQGALLEISDSLLPVIRQVLPEGTVDSLFLCIARTKCTDPGLHYEFCSRILRFSFENNRHPLGSLLPVTFPDVYSGVVRYERKPSFLFSLFNSYDWDKGKELRSTLVDTFLKSQWPATYLALTSNRANILQKVFKRIQRRPGGQQYLSSMFIGLQQAEDDESSAVAAQMASMLDNPDFYEEWD